MCHRNVLYINKVLWKNKPFTVSKTYKYTKLLLGDRKHLEMLHRSNNFRIMIKL